MSNQLFTTVKMPMPKTSTFNLTHDVKMSGKMGLLMPCCIIDALPGDYFKIGADSLIRFAPLSAPTMHPFSVTIHYFFVPNRLLWSNWEKFITGTLDDNGDPHVPPYIEVDPATITPDLSKIMDYMGIPSPIDAGNTTVENISALPFAAYNLIYNEYYRDQNLIAELDGVALADGINNFNEYRIRKRAWMHDYFTACLPFAQKGAAVDIPLGTVVLNDEWETNGQLPAWVDDNLDETNGGNVVAVAGTLPRTPAIEINDGSNTKVAYDPGGSLSVGATTINDLRRAYRLQEWLEKNARGGTRYTEAIKVHFGVKSPDSRLQRPEYITGVKSPIVISEVLNTTGFTDFSTEGGIEQTGSPQGDMSGHGVGITSGRLGSYYCQEHGWIIGIVSIMPTTAYQQGIAKMFTRTDFMDYAFPTFANLGEQEVLNREIYGYGNDSNELFGYIPRYAEYKFMNSRVAGDFKTTLDFWHAGRIFANQPNLNQEFIEMDYQDVERIFAVQDGTDTIWMHILNKVKATRKLPFFGTPTI